MARATTAKKKTTKSAAKPAAVEPRPVLKKRDLIERVVTDTGLKRREVKAVTEAVLHAMGEAVGQGDGLVLEPFGKLRVARATDNGASRVLTCKLRRKQRQDSVATT